MMGELPREERAHQGNPAIVAYCRECRENTVPSNGGMCFWCGTPIGELAERDPEQLELL